VLILHTGRVGIHTGRVRYLLTAFISVAVSFAVCSFELLFTFRLLC
jgi:hypothetical protein